VVTSCYTLQETHSTISLTVQQTYQWTHQSRAQHTVYTVSIIHWACFRENLTRSEQVWSVPSSFFIVSGTKVSCFFIVPQRPVSIQKCSGSEVCKAAQCGKSDLRHTASANQTHCLQTTQFNCFAPDMVLLCSYVPINLVLCILLCVKIIVQVCAFIGLFAGTHFCLLRK